MPQEIEPVRIEVPSETYNSFVDLHTKNAFSIGVGAAELAVIACEGLTDRQKVAALNAIKEHVNKNYKHFTL